MTATLQRPTLPPGTNGSRVANRAVARWARRLLRREWRQQLLVLSLLTVAVAATVVGLGLVTNVQSSDQAYLGSAMTRVDVTSSDGNADSIIAAVRSQLGNVEVIEDAAVPIPGSTASTDVRAMQRNGHFSSPMLRVASGHYPGAGEIAMTRSVLTSLSLRVGQTWTALGRSWRIVGVVENPKNLSDAFALVAPGQLAAPTSISFLANSGGGPGANVHVPSGEVVGIMSNGTSAAARQQSQALAVLLLATIGLTFIGLLSVAGFTVMAQRRLRSLGMIGAIGATDRQVRKVMLANGTAVGFVGAVLGTVIGLGSWVALRPAFENVVGHRINVMSLPWWAVGLGAALAVLASLAASWWPARTVSRMPVVAALSGRPPAPQPAHRFALLGTVLCVIGFVLLARNSHLYLVVLGIVSVTGGALLLAPLGIQALALLARRSPVAVRLALRDLARYQARSGAALAAVSLAVGICATIAISAAAQQAHDIGYTQGNLPNNQLVVWVDSASDSGPGPLGGKVAVAQPDEGPSQAQIASARAAAASIGNALNATPVELDALRNPGVAGSRLGPGGGLATLVRPISENGHKGFSFVDETYLATPALLRLYGISSASIHDPVVTSRSGSGSDKLFDGGSDTLRTVPIQVLGSLPKYTSAPGTLVTQAEATSLGLVAQPWGFVVQTKHALTAAQIRDARNVAAAAGVTVETRSGHDNSLQQLRDYSTLAGVLIALAVLAMTVGLIRSETIGDLRTLNAAGAGGTTRRMLTATTAAALALLGGIIGTAGAYLALIAWHWGDVDYLDKPPLLNLAVLVIGLPVAALVGGAVFGRTPSHLARTRAE